MQDWRIILSLEVPRLLDHECTEIGQLTRAGQGLRSATAKAPLVILEWAVSKTHPSCSNVWCGIGSYCHLIQETNFTHFWVLWMRIVQRSRSTTLVPLSVCTSMSSNTWQPLRAELMLLGSLHHHRKIYDFHPGYLTRGINSIARP